MLFIKQVGLVGMNMKISIFRMDYVGIASSACFFEKAIRSYLEHKKKNLTFFEIMGLGTELKSLTRLIKQLELQYFVKLVGTKPNDCFLQFLNSASLLLMSYNKTSSGNIDGIPVAKIDAMALRYR